MESSSILHPGHTRQRRTIGDDFRTLSYLQLPDLVSWVGSESTCSPFQKLSMPRRRKTFSAYTLTIGKAGFSLPYYVAKKSERQCQQDWRPLTAPARSLFFIPPFGGG